MSFRRGSRMREFHDKVRKAKKTKYPYAVHASDRAFIRWHYGNDLMKLTMTDAHGIYWPDGVYALFDSEVNETYLYFDQREARYDFIRFAVNNYNEITDCASTEKVPLETKDRLFRVTRGIDGALTLVQCGDDDE